MKNQSALPSRPFFARIRSFVVDRLFARDPVLLFLVLIGSYLIFKNLGNMYLWTDEAITAVTARTTIETGLPRGHEGPNWIERETTEKFFGYAFGDVYRAQPWGQFYLTAASFLTFGESPWSARFPFALFGFATIFVVYHLGLRLFQNRRAAQIATLLLICSVPFLLHVRQCRYFAPSIFLVCLSLLFYLNWTEKKSGPGPLVFSLIALNTFTYGTFLPTLGALGVAWLIFDRKKTGLHWTVWIWGIFLLIGTVPWIIFGKTVGYSEVHQFLDLWKYVRFEFRILTKYIFPFAFFAIVFAVGFFFLKKKFWFTVTSSERYSLALLGILILVNLAFFPLCGIRAMHYFIHLVPVLCLIQGYLFAKWWVQSRKFVIVTLALLIFTNLLTRPNGVFAYSSHPLLKTLAGEKTRPRSYFLDYLYEIHHDYDGPMEMAAKYLKQHAQPGDHVKIAYGDVPLMFCLPDLIYEKEGFYAHETYPEWFVWREVWQQIYMDKLKNDPVRYARAQAYLNEIKKRYDPTELNIIDIMWENRPNDMEYHRFRTETRGQKLIILKRKDIVR